MDMAYLMCGCVFGQCVFVCLHISIDFFFLSFFIICNFWIAVTWMLSILCQTIYEFEQWLQLIHMCVIAHFEIWRKCIFKVNAFEASGPKRINKFNKWKKIRFNIKKISQFSRRKIGTEMGLHFRIFRKRIFRQVFIWKFHSLWLVTNWPRECIWIDIFENGSDQNAAVVNFKKVHIKNGEIKSLSTP